MAWNSNAAETAERILDTATALFLEKGYENTTIQDILDRLGNLTKGAVYHHFKGKEDILIAVSERNQKATTSYHQAMLSDDSTSGLEKLRRLLDISLQNPLQELSMQIVPDLLQSPRLFVIQYQSTLCTVAPQILEPILRQAMREGSIPTQSPKELAEVLALLLNVWLNPVVLRCSAEEYHGKYLFFKSMMESMGIDIFTEDHLTRAEHLRSIRQQRDEMS